MERYTWIGLNSILKMLTSSEEAKKLLEKLEALGVPPSYIRRCEARLRKLVASEAINDIRR